MRCHYEVLNVNTEATDDELRKAYRREALKWHPDKNPDDETRATATFRLIQQAYEVLSDSQERAWYDRHRETILNGGADDYEDKLNIMRYFQSSIYKGFGDDINGFYAVYKDLFTNIGEEDRRFVDGPKSKFSFPDFGWRDSDFDEVVRPFYSYWGNYGTLRTFVWVETYDIRDAPNKKIAKLMEKDNKKVRDQSRREWNEKVRQLAAFVKKRDKRMQEHKAKQEELEKERRERLKQIKEKQVVEEAKKLENYKEAEWTVTKENGALDNLLDDMEDSDEEMLRCIACNKTFRSERAFGNHEKSKKHRENVEKLRREMQREDEMFGNVSVGGVVVDGDSGAVVEEFTAPNDDGITVDDVDITVDGCSNQVDGSANVSDCPLAETEDDNDSSSRNQLLSTNGCEGPDIGSPERDTQPPAAELIESSPDGVVEPPLLDAGSVVSELVGAADAKEPSRNSSEPLLSASEPRRDTSEPTQNASEPSPNASEPSPNASEPSRDTSEPIPNTSETSRNTSEPSRNASVSELSSSSCCAPAAGTGEPPVPVAKVRRKKKKRRPRRSDSDTEESGGEFSEPSRADWLTSIEELEYEELRIGSGDSGGEELWCRENRRRATRVSRFSYLTAATTEFIVIAKPSITSEDTTSVDDGSFSVTTETRTDVESEPAVCVEAPPAESAEAGGTSAARGGRRGKRGSRGKLVASRDVELEQLLQMLGEKLGDDSDDGGKSGKKGRGKHGGKGGGGGQRTATSVQKTQHNQSKPSKRKTGKVTSIDGEVNGSLDEVFNYPGTEPSEEVPPSGCVPDCGTSPLPPNSNEIVPPCPPSNGTVTNTSISNGTIPEQSSDKSNCVYISKDLFDMSMETPSKDSTRQLVDKPCVGRCRVSIVPEDSFVPAVLCSTCYEVFPSRNKLFQHLKVSGHSALRSEPDGGSEWTSVRTKRKGVKSK